MDLYFGLIRIFIIPRFYVLIVSNFRVIDFTCLIGTRTAFIYAPHFITTLQVAKDDICAVHLKIFAIIPDFSASYRLVIKNGAFDFNDNITFQYHPIAISSIVANKDSLL